MECIGRHCLQAQNENNSSKKKREISDNSSEINVETCRIIRRSVADNVVLNMKAAF